MSPFLAWGDFHARSSFVRSTIPEEKWGTTRSLHGKGLRVLIMFEKGREGELTLFTDTFCELTTLHMSVQVYIMANTSSHGIMNIT